MGSSVMVMLILLLGLIIEANCVLFSKTSGLSATQKQRLAHHWNHHKFNVSVDSGLPLWGTFRPGIYFGAKQRKPHALATGIMWHSGDLGYYRFRHQTSQDELEQFHWIRHDGRHYGEQHLIDQRYDIDLKTTFLIPSGCTSSDIDNDLEDRKLHGNSPTWVKRVEVASLGRVQDDLQKAMLFYFGVDTDDDISNNVISNLQVITEGGFEDVAADDGGPCESVQTVTFAGKSSQSGWFRIDVTVIETEDHCQGEGHRSRSHKKLSYLGIPTSNILNGVDRIENAASAARFRRPSGQQQSPPTIFDAAGNLNNAFEQDSNFLAVSVKSHADFTLEIAYYEGIDIAEDGSEPELRRKIESAIHQHQSVRKVNRISDEIDKWIENRVVAFDEKFERVFQLSEKGYHGSDDYDHDDSSSSGIDRSSSGSDSSDNASDNHQEQQQQQQQVFSSDDITVGKRAVSAVLGGIGYFYGRPRLGNSLDVSTAEEEVNKKTKDSSSKQQPSIPPDSIESEEYVLRGLPVSLLSATPSRTSFPRGFLWDEGFHQMVISRWDASLSMHIIADWLNAMYSFKDKGDDGKKFISSMENSLSSFFSGTSQKKTKKADKEEEGGVNSAGGGWIPREMILGTEAEKRVPDEFVTQRVNVANPPTLLLVVEGLLQRVVVSVVGGDDDKDKECVEGDAVCKAAWSNNNNSSSSRRRRRRTSHIQEEKEKEEKETILTFLRDAYPALQEWTNWYLNSQRGPDFAEGSFRWRGRALTDQKLIANTLASGLDDYPRSPIPSTEEFHVDLFSWMARATAVLGRISTVLDDAGVQLPADVKVAADNANFGEYANYLGGRLDDLHWSDIHKSYCDVGYSSDKALVINQVYMRCQREEDKRMVDVAVPVEIVRAGQASCPPQFPNFLYIVPDGSSGGYKTKERFLSPEELSIQHVPRIGYVSLFPLLLRLVPTGSPRVDAVLDIIEDPEMLWTDHGLRSIARNDTFYRKQNAPGDEPYWRGPIWMNVNYLALGALHHYATADLDLDALSAHLTVINDLSAGGSSGSSSSSGRKKKNLKSWSDEELNRIVDAHTTQKHRAKTLYQSLRRNLLKTVLSQYHETGYFWEHYDDISGRGTRGHPFSGWTTVIVNIMAELY